MTQIVLRGVVAPCYQHQAGGSVDNKVPQLHATPLAHRLVADRFDT